MAPIMCAEAGVTELLELAATLRVFISCVEQYPHDAVAGAVAARAKGPLAQVAELCVRGVLDEFKVASATGNVLSLLSAVWFTREFCETSASARQLVLQYGGMDLLGPALLAPEADDRLIKESVHLLHYLQGCKGLLEVIPKVLHGNPRIVVQLLWRVREDFRANWHSNAELRTLQPGLLVHVVMNCIQTYPSNWNVHEAALALLSDVLGTAEYRTAFAENGGWSHVLMVLESQGGQLEVHRRGLQILCELQRGGAWGGAHMKRCQLAVLKTLDAFHEDDNILEWSLWLLLEIGGLPHVLQILERAGPTSKVGICVLEALRLVHWGETEEANLEIAPSVMRVLGAIAIHAMQVRAMPALTLCIGTLLDVCCLSAAVPDEKMLPELSQAQAGVVEIILQILRHHMVNVLVVKDCLQIVRIFQAANEGSSSQGKIHEGLLGGSAPNLLQQVTEMHNSQGDDSIHKEVLWVQGVLLGPGAIARMMEGLSGSLSCANAGVKILGLFYGDQDDIDNASCLARDVVLQAIVRTMERWPQESHLLTHACYALSALALHGNTNGTTGNYNDQHIQFGLQASWKIAVPLATQLDGQDLSCSRSKARYLRQEVIRHEMESIRAAAEPVRQELRKEALRVGAAAAQCRSLFRDAQAGVMDASDLAECLRLALVTLGVHGQAEPTVQALREGGLQFAPVAGGAAQAAVDLCRLGMHRELQVAGLAEVARGIRDGCHSTKKHLEPDWIEVLSVLQFAEDWLTS